MTQKSSASIICKKCNSPTFMREVVYGLPEFPFDESKYVIGGCIPGGPKWQCIKCKPVGDEYE